MSLLDTMKLSVAAAFFAIASVEGFTSPSQSTRGATSLNMSLEKYSDELRATAAAMVRPGHGLLACDESTGTVGKRLWSHFYSSFLFSGASFFSAPMDWEILFPDLFFSRKLFIKMVRMLVPFC